MTREEILAMDTDELSIAVAETIFQAKVVGKENDPNAKLLIGWYGYKAWQPMRSSWTAAEWSPTEEIAWLDCPRFAEDIAAAWEVVGKIGGMEEWMLYRVSHSDTVNGVDLGYACEFLNVKRGYSVTCEAISAPEAICKAALLAVLEATP